MLSIVPCNAVANSATNWDATLKSVSHVVGVIEYLQAHPGVRLVEIAERVGVHKSNASRLLKALRGYGWIARDTTGLTYRIGARLVSIGQTTINQFALADQLIPMMQMLRDASGETVHVAVFDDGDMLHVRRIESPEVIRVACPLGTRDKLHCTALGKAFLAALPDTEMKRVMNNIEFEKRTPNTITDRAAFLLEMRKTRARGYSIDNEEGRLGVRCLGVPLIQRSGQAVGALSVAGPSERWTQKAMDKVVVRLLDIFRQGVAAAGYRGFKNRRLRNLAS
jgi:DNA-binding IclR family transcriptional regulator